LVDCSKNGNYGCDGGDLWPAYEYVVDNGIESEDDYKYTARDGRCKFDKTKVVWKPSGYKKVKANQPSQMAAALN